MDPTRRPSDAPTELDAARTARSGVALLPDHVEHDGLVLRRWTPDDAELLGRLVTANLEHLRPYLRWIADEPLAVERRRALLVEWEQAWRAGGDVLMAIVEDGVAVGSTGLHRRIGPAAVEIGYWVDAGHLGRGIARRASAGLTSLAFTIAGIEAVEIHHDLTNVHSRRVPEQLGFHLVGTQTLDRELAPAESGIELRWRMVRDEWRSRFPAAG